jgi:hypothetical protein
MTDMTPGSPGEPQTVPPAEGPGAEQSPETAVSAERERLARELRDTRMQLAMTQARLTAVEGSASWRLGRVVANAAKRPWPRGATLPRDLYRLWRERGATPTAAQNSASALAAAQLTDLAGSGDRFLSALTTPGATRLADPALTLSGDAGNGAADRGPVITGVLSALACATLAPDAVVHPLLPHDADVVVESVGADLVVIEAAALLPGNPWAYATDPAAADRGRRLARMILMARALGKPVVLIRNVPQSRMPGLSWLVPTVDAVLDMDLGVQLARFNPVGAAAARPAEPVYAGDRDPREAPGVRALLDALTSGAEPAVALAGARSWRALPELYRSHAVFVTATDAQRAEQQASGARVIQLGGPAGVRDADAARARLAEARAAGPLPMPEIRAGLRDIFTSHATPARLAALVRAAGLPASVSGGRQVAVLAQVGDAAAAGRLAAALKRQRLAPAEVIVAAVPGSVAAAAREALSGLTDKGVRVLVTDPGAAGASASAAATLSQAASTTGSPVGDAWARPLARSASSPWVALWPGSDGAGPGDGELPDTYLLDLACARECSQADAVGPPAGNTVADEAGEYAFTTSLTTPALVRRDLVVPGAPPPSGWGAHGLRLFTVTR